jgi:hypothetical protein
VLQQFNLLPKQPVLEAKEKQMKVKIVQSSVGSSVVSLVPFAVREFHKVKTMSKLLAVVVLFGGANYLQMRPYFSEYIVECGKVAQGNIGRLVDECRLPTD